MRSEKEMMELILGVAEADERIRAVLMVGSRADSDAPKDQYRDYDIGYYVHDVQPFWDNDAWLEERFGKALIIQKPELMRGADNDGHFTYLVIFEDGNRIDLSFEFRPYIDDGEPAVILLDKDNGFGAFLPPEIKVNEYFFAVKPPTELDYYSACNEFWWCLNNAAKGIARDELPYVQAMLNHYVRNELNDMVGWYIGILTDFTVSAGKLGKYFKRYLPQELYERYAATYSGGDYADIWRAIGVMCDLFRKLALKVAEHFGFEYRQNEENGMRAYLKMVRDK
ncbi:MAG: aminoglycoside 6-adenylyltransferase [Oscillospiraceae bacterium]|jgi:aminoglycoside 6-adenylyltransferase|nr:aminoglycoside 6-adenylyltransferase [Oscillospiraceae bacterium]